MRHLDQLLPVALLAVAAVYICAVCVATCSCTPSVTPAHAEAAYTAELLRCVDSSHTLDESRACRAQVDQRWNIRDGGTHGDR